MFYYRKLFFYCQDTSTESLLKLWNPNVYIENTVGQSDIRREITAELIKGVHYITETKIIAGTFSQTMDIHYFPFDVQVRLKQAQ